MNNIYHCNNHYDDDDTDDDGSDGDDTAWEIPPFHILGARKRQPRENTRNYFLQQYRT